MLPMLFQMSVQLWLTSISVFGERVRDWTCSPGVRNSAPDNWQMIKGRAGPWQENSLGIFWFIIDQPLTQPPSFVWCCDELSPLIEQWAAPSKLRSGRSGKTNNEKRKKQNSIGLWGSPGLWSPGKCPVYQITSPGLYKACEWPVFTSTTLSCDWDAMSLPYNTVTTLLSSLSPTNI